MYPRCFGEAKEIVEKKHHIDGLINHEVVPGLRYITSLVVYYER